MWEFIQDALKTEVFWSALTALSAIFASAVAFLGVKTWRKEHTGKRNIELAEDTLALFYEAVDAIKYVRHPTSYESETKDIKKAVGETEAKFDARKRASVVFFRFDKYQDLFNKIYASRYRFMAQIGKDEATPFDKLNEIKNKIVLSASRLMKLWPREFTTDKEWEKHNKRVDRYELIFWDHSENDKINQELIKIIEDIEKICKSVINGK